MAKKDNKTSFNTDKYDAGVRQTIPYYDTIHEEIHSFIESMPLPPSSWLDTGCGTGTFVKLALNRFPETHFFLADPSRSMLDLAKEKLPDNRVTFLGYYGTAELPPKAGPFEVITAIQCHHYLDRKGRKTAIGVCYSLLKSGGILILSENIRPFTSLGQEIGLRYWGKYQEKAGKKPKDVKEHLDRFDREYFPITIEEHLSLYRSIGFSAVEVLWCSYLQAIFYAIK